MTKVVIYPGIEIGRDNAMLRVQEDFKEDCEVFYPQNREEFLASAQNADVLFVYWENPPKEYFETAQNLKWYATCMAGVNALPLDVIQKKGYILTNGRGLYDIHMAEYAIGMMILDVRNLDQCVKNQEKKVWQMPPQNQIYGKCLGILGLGSIGQEVAKKASAMGMRVIGTKRNQQAVPFVDAVYAADEIDEIFKESDYVINLMPQTSETAGSIGKRQFERMKPSACIINMGRGSAVVEAELVAALNEGVFRRYISDVFVVEPLPSDSVLWEMENVLITPHICGPNETLLDKAYPLFKHNLQAFLDGRKDEMKNVYSYTRGY